MRLHVLSPSSVGISAVACMLVLLLFTPRSHAQAPVFSQMSLTPGASGKMLTITGEKFGYHQFSSNVTFGGVPATVKRWLDTEIVVFIPSLASTQTVNVMLTINKASVSDNGEIARDENLGPFTIQASTQSSSGHAPTVNPASVTVAVPPPPVQASPAAHAVNPPATPTPANPATTDQLQPVNTPATAKIDPPTGAPATTVKITGADFGVPQGKVFFGGVQADFAATGWTSKEIDVAPPDLHLDTSKNVIVLVQDSSGNTIANGTFTENPAVKISPAIGAPGTSVTITGAALPASQGSNNVMFSDSAANLTANPDAIVNWDKTGIKLKVPDLVTESESRDVRKLKDDLHGNKPNKDQINAIKAARNNDDMLTVRVVDTNNKSLPNIPSLAFTETQPRWSDDDEKPLGIKIVGGYEQGYQSAQQSASDAFLAIYGRSLFLKDTFGPFFHIRLQTAPVASATYGVVSVLSNPSGAVTSQNLQTVGSAVDLSLGLEYQIRHGSHHGQSSLGFIAGGGFVTPLQVNSITASFVMPAFGTVECTDLQSRLSGLLTNNSLYAGITPTTSTTTPSTTACYSNNTTGTKTPISTLEFAAPNQPNFFPKYSVGVRLVNRFPGANGLKQCDENNPCERGYADFTLGQNASISGGTLKHLVVNVDSIYPLPVPSLNFIYLFGSVSKRLDNLPASQTPLVLASPPTSGPSTPPAAPNPAVLVLPMTQPDRDFYRFGIGVSLCQIYSALTTKGSPCKF